jgi:hypothetical protein
MSAEKERGEIVERAIGRVHAEYPGDPRLGKIVWYEAPPVGNLYSEAALTTAKQEAFKAGIEAAANVADELARDNWGFAAEERTCELVAEAIRTKALAQPEQGEAG